MYYFDLISKLLIIRNMQSSVYIGLILAVSVNERIILP
jgi:hypothetical protein